MTPFKIAVADEAIADLKDRLAHTRLPDEVEGAGWDYGTSMPFLARFIDYWANQYDWRKAEAGLNGFSHFTAQIDGETVHFVEARGQGEHSVPLLLANGWPSNFVELLPVVPLLTEERDGVSYDVIIPSLPGYGFSGRPRHKGMNLTQAGHLWAKLMAGLGHERFLISGSDLGAGVLLSLVRNYPERIIGAHYNNVYWGHQRPEKPTPEEQAYFQKLDLWRFTEGGYAMEQGTKPTTLAVGLNDSPGGLASWVIEKYRTWGNTNGDIESVFRLEDLATILSVYWFTQTIGSSMRIYKEAFADTQFIAPVPRHAVPQGVLVPADSDLPAPRAWADRHLQNLVHWNEAKRSGHFPALEAPELYAGDIRTFHREIGGRKS